MLEVLKQFTRLIPDRLYLKIKFFMKLKKKLNLKNPKTFNEKLQWLKLNNRKEIYNTMVDKYEAKKYVSNIIGEEYIIPTYGIYNSFNEIKYDELPKEFVIKCTHDSGGIVIVKDKKNLDVKEAEKIINRCLKNNYYYSCREWPYKSVKPRIIIEKYMVDESGVELKDYKFFCFNGKVKYIQVDFNRFNKHTKNIYDKNWNFQNFQINYPNDKSHKIEKPQRFDDMINFAESLSKGQEFLRVDFYSIGDKIYFGELTFYPGGGFMPFEPKEWDKKLGDLIKLPIKK